MKKYRIFIILLIITLILLAGCKKEEGGGEGDSGNTHDSGENSSSRGNEGNLSSGDSSDSSSEKIYVRHILVDTRVKAEEIIDKLKDGADFEEMAREYSKCPSKIKGGKLDPFGKGEKAQFFELASLALKSGEISGPIETEYGWEIIERLPTPVPPTPTPVPPVRIRHIIVAHEEEAKEIIEELKNGGDFTHLAMEKSLCPSRAKGGELGLIHYGGQLIPELETVAFSLEIGEISEPVKTDHGWHVIQRIDPDMKIELPELEKVRIRHILVEQEEVAKEIYEELKAGGDFTRLAADRSICTTKEKGGDLGEFTIGVMTKSIEDAALALKTGEISEPVESPYGWHIIQRLELDYEIELLPEEIRISHILVKTKEEAEEILKELKEGKKFEDLAREKSRCPSAEKGGDFGVIKQDELVQNFNDTVFFLKIGEISEPVQTMEGWHIVMRTE